jgi:hypothetical protein
MIGIYHKEKIQLAYVMSTIYNALIKIKYECSPHMAKWKMLNLVMDPVWSNRSHMKSNDPHSRPLRYASPR